MKSPLSSVCRSLVVSVLVLGLAACASTGGSKKKAGDYTQLMGTAEAEVSAGRLESALAGFNEAAKADPTRKEPWVRSAQLQFDAGNYGRAIVAAEEVLKRDPTDKVADSVLTVSGLRVASQSLKRLQGNGALASDTARREAEQLRTTMIATMGNDFVVGEDAKPKPKAKPRPRQRPTPSTAPTATAPAAQPAPTTSSNPFD
ncbi:tetratricopeptide repeat protein [Lysobacter cavernae]|uniref:Tetratricopeptide repeat protein n=1 Tax=Lysobacter cavernae TaxID=1685901 RepID=A0ABV7RUZ3_9GAMM